VNPQQAILRYARRARRRLALVRGVDGATKAIFWALCVATAAVAAHKLFGTPLALVPWAIGLGASVVVVGLLTAVFPRLTLFEAAGAVDAGAGWKERLSSAMALATVAHPMEQALLDDVARRLSERKPSQLFPLRVPGAAKYAPLLVAAIIVLAQVVPSIDLFGLETARKEKQKEKEAIEAAIEKLEQRKKELQKGEQLGEKVKQVLDKIDALEKELHATPPMEKKEALAKVNALTDELSKMKNDLAKAQSMAEKIQKAAAKDTSGETGELGKLMKEGKFKEAAQELAKMQKALQEGKLSKTEQEKLKKQLEKLAEKMAKDKDLSEFEKKLAKAMQGMEQGQEQGMDDLAQQLESLDGELNDAEALAEALKDLENLSDALAKGEGECPS
jgi:hypothetical protein